MAAEWIALLPLAQLTPGTMQCVLVDGLPVGVAHAAGNIYAFADTCRHEGGSLASGALIATTVTCPWHGWTYELQTGKAIVPPVGIRIPVYPTEVRDGMIYAAIDWGE
jgi:nitrite reductase/ring-hydroxylating ferredoxin subunit